LTKVGAAGLLGGILLDKGIAFALKIRDGSDLARPLATLEVLGRLGHLRSSNETLLRRNAVGNPVGHWESHWNRE
jgi:L-asparaginase II